jgi:uncharacterized ubiquitin-like protein YukD
MAGSISQEYVQDGKNYLGFDHHGEHCQGYEWAPCLDWRKTSERTETNPIRAVGAEYWKDVLIITNEDLENIVKEMNKSLVLTEEKLMKEMKQTQGDLLELETKNVQLREDLINTKVVLINTEMEVSLLKEPPFFHASSFQGYTDITGQTIPWGDLLRYVPWPKSQLLSKC